MSSTSRRGALCISIDVELAWGVADKPSARYFSLCAAKESYIVERLLKMCASYGIVATWAIVGRLLERHGPVPVASREGDRIWYAPKMIDRIRRASPVQDVGSHGFAHIYFDQAGRESTRIDIERARRVHQRHGLDFTSFVFPRNRVAHLDLLARAGISVYRSVDVGWHMAVRQRAGRVAGRLANLTDKALPVPPTPVQPTVHGNGLVELPSSMLLLGRSGLRRLAPPELVQAKAKLGLRAAARSGGIFHLWFHPSNFYHQTETQLRVLDRTLRLATDMRDRGELDIRSMKSYAPLAAN